MAHLAWLAAERKILDRFTSAVDPGLSTQNWDFFTDIFTGMRGLGQYMDELMSVTKSVLIWFSMFISVA